MTETEFRISHSRIIQYYQLVEDRLRAISAALLADEDRNWIDRLEDYETDALGKLIYQAQQIQKNGRFDFLPETDFDSLHELRKNRNYWCHECFNGDTPVTFRNGNVRRAYHSERLERDLEEAVIWDEKLTEVFRSIDGLKDLRKGIFDDFDFPDIITGVEFIPFEKNENEQ